MDNNSLNLFFSLMILVCGGYCLYQAIYLIRTGKIPNNCILLSKERPLSACLDPEGFLSYMKPRFLIFSVAIVISSLVSVLDETTQFISSMTTGLSQMAQLIILEATSVVIPLVIIIWFGVCLVRIQKKLW